MEIRVIPSALQQTAGTLQGLAQDVDGIQGSIRGATAGVGAACGFPEAGGPFEEMAHRWLGALGRSAAGVSGLGTSLSTAAALYELTDETAMALLP